MLEELAKGKGYLVMMSDAYWENKETGQAWESPSNPSSCRQKPAYFCEFKPSLVYWFCSRPVRDT